MTNNQERPTILWYWDAIKFLWIAQSYFDKLVKAGKIPFTQTSSWKIFFQKDLEDFNEVRKQKSKTDPRVKIKKT